MDCENVLTYNYSVDLPIDSSSPPTTYFVITFNCNGVVFQSDQLNNSTDALAWVQDSLSEFGDWSLSGDTLIIENSLCSSASLSTQSFESNSDADIILSLDSSSPETIVDIYGLAAVDVSVDGAKSSNTTWRNDVSQLQGLFVEPITGSTSQWALYKSSGSDGYNIVISEVNARGKNINTLLDGIGAKTYGYGFFEDALGYIKLLSPKPKIVVSFDLIRPVLNGSYAQTYSEVDYVVSACATAGVTIRCFQLCYEMGLKSNNDVFTSASAISIATQTVATYIHTHYPTIKISADANNWDDENLNYPTLNTLINGLSYIDYVRQYFQFDETLTSYDLCRARIDDVPDMFTFFTSKFTHSQKLRLAQSTFKTGNPLRLKVGEGLIYAELLIKLINENLKRSNLVIDFSHMNLSRLVSGSSVLYPAFYFMTLLRNAFLVNGKIEATYSDSDTEDSLITLGTLSSGKGIVYIINPNDNFVTIDSVKLNGVAKSVTISGYYGSPLSDTATNYISSGTSVLLYPHSLTKISTV